MPPGVLLPVHLQHFALPQASRNDLFGSVCSILDLCSLPESHYLIKSFMYRRGNAAASSKSSVCFVLFCFYILHLFNKYIWSKTYVNSLIIPRLFVSGMNAFDGLTPGWASWRIQGNFSNFEGLRSSSLLLLCHTSSDTCGWAYFSKVTSWPIL